MAVETELKLQISPEHLARLKRHSFLRSLSSARALTRKLHNVYFDTPDLYLHRHAMALRLRRCGRKWLQTLKGGGMVQAGLHQRNEWETPVSGEALDFSALEASGAMHLPKHVRKELQAMFVTDFSRTSRMVNFEGALIELSMDSGEIIAGEKKRIISELELELKSGEPVQLFRLGLSLAELVPLQVEAISKAEYGYRLWTHVPAEVSRVVAPEVDENSTVAAAMQGMIWSCLLSLQANMAGAVFNLNDEFLHQMRVSLRRLRMVLGMAAKIHEDYELSALRMDIAVLGAELGFAREWDVFVTQTLKPLRLQLNTQVDIEPLVHSCERQRRGQHEQVRQLLQSQDFQRLLLRFGAWMFGAYWHDPCWREAPGLQSFAESTLRRRSRGMRKIYAQLAPKSIPLLYADSNELHELRIACKKLRYSAELFASLYSGDKSRRYQAAVGKMQDILGVLNDIAVARRFLDQLGKGALHETCIMVRGWVEHDYAQQLSDLHVAWKKLSKRDEFWR